MTEPAASVLPAAPARAEGPAAQVLRIARGFSCLFWSLPLLAAAHAAALGGALPTRWTAGLLPLCFVPLAGGLWMLRAGGEPTPKWRAKIARVSLLALVVAGLCPFLAWWSQAPTQVYFAVNAGAHYLALVALLAGLTRLASEEARWLGDASLRRESVAGLGMVLWLSACTAGALVWLFHRAGLLEAGWPTVLAQLAALPAEARTLFLLPYAMTAYVTWRAKETGFRRAASLLAS